MAIHKSKVSDKVTYVTSKSGSYNYLVVLYSGKIIREYKNGPVKLKSTMAKVEAALTDAFLGLCEERINGVEGTTQESLNRDAYFDFVAKTDGVRK